MNEPGLQDRLTKFALLVVDVQNDFCDPDGAYAGAGFPIHGVADAVPKIQELVKSIRAGGHPVIFTQMVYPRREDGSGASMDEGLISPPSRLEPLSDRVVSGTWGAELLPVLSIGAGDEVVVKHSFSAFFDTRLHSLLRRQAITSLVVCGLASNGCVLHTAFDAYVRGYDLVFVRDAIASYWPDLHASAMAIMTGMLGYEARVGEVVGAVRGVA